MKRNIQLDVVRGIAIVMVLGTHFRIDPPESGFIRWFADAWDKKGVFGVPLFFTLSGFLIGGLLISELKKRGCISVPRFLIRRGWKIYPPYYLFMAYLIMMPIAKAVFAGQGIWDTTTTTLTNYWPSLLFVQNYLGPIMAGHTWSLAVEEHFYIVLPLAIAWLTAMKRLDWLMPFCLLSPIVFTGLRLALAAAGDPYMLDTSRTMAATHLNIDALLFGVGLRGLAEYKPDVFERIRPWRYVLLVIGCSIVFFWPNFTILDLPNYRIIPRYTIAAGAVLLGIYFVRQSDFGSSGTTVKPLAGAIAWMGTHSYCIYLWHVTLMGIAAKKLVVHLPWETTTPHGWILGATVLCAAAIAGGALVSSMIERPMLLLRDKYFPSRA
jgi:peptidoglycan/LPS O-acetylase OafA/YrhL